MLRRSTFTLEEVQSMLADHIVFNNHYPVGKSIVGDHLLCDGIFDFTIGIFH